MSTKIRLSQHVRRLGSLALVLSMSTTGCKKGQETTTPEPLPIADSTPTQEPEQAKAPTRAYPEPPAPGEPKPVNFPDIDTFTLSNGLTVYVVESRGVPMVSAQLVVRAGTMDDEHVAEFTSAMLGEGTKTRSKAKIDEAIEFVGGRLGGGASTHVSYLTSRVLTKDLRLGLTLMADQVMNPSFPADALLKLKEQSKTAIGILKSQPAQLAAVLFDQVAYPEGHPYGRPLPTEEQVDQITVENVRKFHETFYRANNSFLILSGDVDKKEAETLVRRTFANWRSAGTSDLPPNPLNSFTEYELPEELVIHLVDRPTSAQSEIIVGNLALARNHEDYPKLQIANSILGDDATGRLFRDIREERGLTYGIYSSISDRQAPGTFTITTRTRTNTTGEMLGAIFEHIGRLRNEPPTSEEVAAVASKTIGAFPLQIETPGDIASKVRELLIYNLPTDYWRTYRDDLASVSAEDVHKATRKYIHPIPHVVIVGKATKVEKDIKKVLPKAKIKKYDENLAPL
jgi:zinc protease